MGTENTGLIKSLSYRPLPGVNPPARLIINPFAAFPLVCFISPSERMLGVFITKVHICKPGETLMTSDGRSEIKALMSLWETA